LLYATIAKASFGGVFTVHKRSDYERIKTCCVLTFIKSAGFYSIALGINYFIPKGILELVVHLYRDNIPGGIKAYHYSIAS
jgi:hypothetical protein